MKLTTDRPFADPEKAARKLVELANTVETIMDGRVLIESINLPFLREGGSPAEYRAGLDRAIAKLGHAASGRKGILRPLPLEQAPEGRRQF